MTPFHPCFKGPFTVPRSSLNAARVGILVQLSGEHQLDAASATGSAIFPPFPTGSVSDLPTALLTRYAVRFHAASPRTQFVLILCLSSGYTRKHLQRLPPGAVLSITRNRVLYHLEALDRRMAVWKSAMLHDVQAAADGAPDGCGMHFMSLNIQQSLRPKVRALSSLIQSFSFPDIISLREIGALPESFSIHPLYASFFSLTNRKCLGVAVLIRRDDGYAFHRVDIRADSRGVAVWFGLAGAPLLVIGVYLPTSGPTKAYEPILHWTLAHILASARYLHVVFGDINQNPGLTPHFRHLFSDMGRLFSDFLEEANLRCVPPQVELPTWVGVAGVFQRGGPLPHFYAPFPRAG